MAGLARIETQDDGAARAQLTAWLTELDRDAARLSLTELGRRVAGLRAQAQAHRLDAAARLAESLGVAVARDGHAAIVRPYLAGIREALGGCAQDAATADRLLASVNVRLVC